ncbi:hypothetical protein BOX15_Mlig006472g1, partial [Macrostomum lignano]
RCYLARKSQLRSAKNGIKMTKWEDIVKLNYNVPPSEQNIAQDNQNLRGYAIRFQNIKVTLNDALKAKIAGARQLKCQANLFMYDSYNQRFFGRAWSGPTLDGTLDGSQLKLAYPESVYFMSPLVANNESGCLLLEVVGHMAPGSRFSCGWCQLKVFSAALYRQLPDFRKKGQQQAATPTEAGLYAGSCRSFVSMKEDGLGQCRIVGSVSYQLFRHPSLEACTDAFPENAIVGGREPVPGLVPGAEPLRKPQLAPRQKYTFENLVITVSPSLLSFEEELKRLLTDDRRVLDPSCRPLEISERRLKVGVHNGWEYLDHEVSIGLVPAQEGSDSAAAAAPTPTTHRRSLSAGKMSTLLERGVLVAKNPVQVELPPGPGIAVVLVLEYVMSEPAAQSGAPKAQQTLSVRYGAYSLPEDQQQQQQPPARVALQLGGGPDSRFPDKRLLFKQNARLGSAQGVPQHQVTLKATLVASAASAASAAAAAAASPMSTQQPPTLQSHQHHYFEQQQRQQPQQIFDESNLIPSARMSLASAGLAPGEDAEPPPGSTLTLQQQQQQALMSNPVFLLSQVLMRQGYGVGVEQDPFASAGHLSSRSGPLVATVNGGSASAAADASLAPLRRHLSTAVCALGRGDFARLAGAGFAPILDAYGEPPEVVDEAKRPPADLRLEEEDPMSGNELVLQFLAYSAGTGTANRPRSVFLAFQFYRFPHFTTERLALADTSFTEDGRAFILERAAAAAATAPGFEVRFSAEPALPGERARLAAHLRDHSLHIDVFDGDSLLYIGSCGLGLRPLLRQGKKAVQTWQVLAILQPDQPAEPQMRAAPQLHVRAACVGYRAGAGPGSTRSLHLAEPSSGQRSAPVDGTRRSLARAKVVRVHQADLPKDLRVALNGGAGDDSDRARRLARLQAVKAANSQVAEPDVHAAAVIRADAASREKSLRELHTIDFVRERAKDSVIMDLLESTISVEHDIHTTFGCTEFFEFAFDNPSNNVEDVSVEVEDTERRLQILTDPAVTLALKAHFGVATNTERDLFHRDDAEGGPGNTAQAARLTARPRERVLIPFRYFETGAYAAAGAATAAESSQPRQPGGLPAFRLGEGGPDTSDERRVKAYVRSKSGVLLSVLHVSVHRHPAAVDQTLRFYQSESTFFKRSIRMPPLPAVAGDGNQVTYLCSDPNAVCHVQQPKQSGDPVDLFVKLSCGESPRMQRLLLAVYTDPFQIAPRVVTQLLVQSLQQVDITCSLGQPAQRALLIRGFANTRRICCYPSHPGEISVEPSEPFALPAATSREVTVAVQPRSVGRASYRVSLVDADLHQLLKCWLFNVSCELPELIRTLDVALPLGGGRHCNRKFNYTNEYSIAKRFIVSCNRPDLLQFSPTEMSLPGHGQDTIRLHFVPQTSPGRASIFFFIYDDAGRNEETVLFRVTYGDAANAAER